MWPLYAVDPSLHVDLEQCQQFWLPESSWPYRFPSTFPTFLFVTLRCPPLRGRAATGPSIPPPLAWTGLEGVPPRLVPPPVPWGGSKNAQRRCVRPCAVNRARCVVLFADRFQFHCSVAVIMLQCLHDATGNSTTDLTPIPGFGLGTVCQLQIRSGSRSLSGLGCALSTGDGCLIY